MHGDTIGDTPGDRSVRCFFGDSRADRVRKVKAMFLEFDTDAVAAPRKDLPFPGPGPVGFAPRPAPPPAQPGRRGSDPIPLDDR